MSTRPTLVPASTSRQHVRERELYGSGSRMSAQRTTIARAVLAMHHAFTVDDLHAAVGRWSPGIGLATVYRAVAAMLGAGTVVVVGTRNGSGLLARCGRGDHHHHLICASCASVVGIECPIADSAHDVAEREGYLITDHQLTLYGLCPTCRQQQGDD